jgi:hypothetical protein
LPYPAKTSAGCSFTIAEIRAILKIGKEIQRAAK